jgi:hypothetical protein
MVSLEKMYSFCLHIMSLKLTAFLTKNDSKVLYERNMFEFFHYSEWHMYDIIAKQLTPF